MAYVRVQGVGTQTTPGNTAVATFGAAVGSGNFAWGIATWDASTGFTVTGVADDKGNTYSFLSVNDAVDNQSSIIFWRGNVTGGPTAITVTWTGAPGFRFMAAEEWSGVFAATDPKDVAPAGTSNTPSVTGADGITSSNITTLTNGCLILGATSNDDGGGVANAGTGYSAGTRNSGTVQLDTEFKTQATAGLVKATFTESSVASNRTVWVLAVQPAAGGGATLVGPQLNPALPGFRSGHFPRSDSTLLASPLPRNQFNAGWEVQPVQPRALLNNVRAASLAGGDPGIVLPFSQWLNAGLEIQPVQPPNRATNNRKGAILRGDDGTAGIASAVVSAVVGWGFDQFPVYLAPRPTVQQRGSAASVESVFAAFSTNPWTDDLAGHWKRPKFINPALVGDDGITLPSTPVVTKNWGFDNSLPLLMRLRRLDPALAGDQGQQSPFSAWLNSGWEIASPQPPHRRPERSGSLMMLGDGGVQAGKINFFPTGFEAVLHQPSHPRPERAGALISGEPGNEGLYTFIPSFLAPWGYDAQPYQPQHPRPERFAAIMRGDDGSQATRINFFPFGWEVQPVQPQHPTPERRAAAIMPREDGIEQIALRWLNAGWEIAPHQPAHRRPEKAGGIMPVEPGNEGIYSFVTAPFVAHGYDPTAYMPRVRFARAGALARGEDGTEGLYSVWLPLAWQTPEANVRARRSGVGTFQDNFVPGIRAKLVWTDMAGPPVLPTRRRLQARTKFNIEAKFVFVPPPPVTFVSVPDNLLRRSFSHPGAAIMQFDGGWFQQRYVAVFFATSTITQALAVSAVTQARAETEATQATAVTSTTAASGDTSVTAAAAETVLSGETPGR